MLLKLILTLSLSFVILNPSLAIERGILQSKANSPAWLKLLYYQKSWGDYVSKAYRDQFFFSPTGKKDPVAELHAFIEVITNKRAARFELQKNPACSFPARYELVRSWFPELPEAKRCPDYEDWIKRIDPGQLYLVFSSSYPNNPASMFGHTFFRLDRKSKAHIKGAKELLGYSFAFMAQTLPGDNAFMYTYKGVTGGYISYLDIKPFYMNVGIYNNSESRDLWEYPIPLTEKQKVFFIKHLWEISLSTGFRYYFFDENCSTFLLKVLEAVNPAWNFTSDNDLFVLPRRTLRELVSVTNHMSPNYRPSIKKHIFHNFNQLNKKDQSLFAQAKKDIKKLEKIQSIPIVDGLIDYWKFTNYKKKTRLDDNERKLMHATLLKRSQMEGSSISHIDTITENHQHQAPHRGLDDHQLGLAIGDQHHLFFKYGFHSFHDPFSGQDDQAFIKFMQGEVLYDDDKFYLEKFRLLEILSLQNFFIYYPQISWNITVDINNESFQSKLPHNAKATGGVGLSHSHHGFQSYLIFSGGFFHNLENGYSNFYPLVKLGIKQKSWENLSAAIEAVGEHIEGKDHLSSEINISYQMRHGIIGLRYRHQKRAEKNTLQAVITHHF